MRSQKVWHSGVFLVACNFVVALGNYAFQGLIGRQLSLAEYGYANAAANAVLFLSLPVMAATNALTHYVARFRASGREAELRGLISSTRKWLGLIVASGFILALLLLHPLTTYCGFPRTSLVLTMIISTVAMLGIAFVAALCTGMGWYARLGFIGVGAMIVKLFSVWTVTRAFPIAEGAVVATALSAVAYAMILFWWSDVSRAGEEINPINRDFGWFVLAALASAFGSYGFTQSDVLIAQRNLAPETVAQFCAAGVFGRAMLGLTGPLLTVFFATRSASEKPHAEFRAYAMLVGLYLLAMSAGVAVITYFREPLIHSIFGHAEPAAAALVGRFAFLIFCLGAIEVLGNWALASRWFRVVHAQFALAVVYVGVGLAWGTDASQLLNVLIVAAIAAFVFLLGFSFVNAKRARLSAANIIPAPLQPIAS